MTPVDPGKKFDRYKPLTFAKDQPQYSPLPARAVGDSQRTIITSWKLSWKEKLQLLWTGRVYLTILTFGKPLQPVRMDVTAQAAGGRK